jgi:Flp pilus assembly protein TadD
MQLAQEMLAFFLNQNEKPDEAIRLLQREVAAGSANDAMRTRLGLMLSESGRAGEAVAVLRPLAEKGDPDVLNAYGIALADSGDVGGAVAQFQRILSANDRNAKAWQNLGIVALRAGEAARARGYLEHALAIDARLPLALNALGVIEAQGGNGNAAIELWSRAVAIDPSLLDALYNLGLVAHEQHRNDVARDALGKYLKRAPEARYAKERTNAQAILTSLR